MRPAKALMRLMQNRVISTNGCWEWQGPYHTAGYGLLCKSTTHRWAARLFLGVNLTKRDFVCHRCDNPKCYNPAHLFIGTQAENMADMASKGRAAKGSAHGQSRLTEAGVQGLIALWNSGATMETCARKFGVTHSCVQKILERKTWAWLTANWHIRPSFHRGYVRHGVLLGV